ncbi:MAG: hypothetical protein OXC44_00955, partial [Proteobacteria bacterium]|nr:hypothetical protein [Pseudomonadota bacterium]
MSVFKLSHHPLTSYATTKTGTAKSTTSPLCHHLNPFKVSHQKRNSCISNTAPRLIVRPLKRPFQV